MLNDIGRHGHTSEVRAGVSLVIWDITQCYLQPDARPANVRFTYPWGVESWVDLLGIWILGSV